MKLLKWWVWKQCRWWLHAQQGYELFAICSNSNFEYLALLPDLLGTAYIKPEEWSYFLSPKSLIVFHILADLKSVFLDSYMRKVDKDDALTSECFF